MCPWLGLDQRDRNVRVLVALPWASNRRQPAADAANAWRIPMAPSAHKIRSQETQARPSPSVWKISGDRNDRRYDRGRPGCALPPAACYACRRKLNMPGWVPRPISLWFLCRGKTNSWGSIDLGRYDGSHFNTTPASQSGKFIRPGGCERLIITYAGMDLTFWRSSAWLHAKLIWDSSSWLVCTIQPDH